MFKAITVLSALRRLKHADQARPGLPGEHWLTASAGMWLLTSAGKQSSLAGRLVFGGLGLALLMRSASGRDGLSRLKR
jgi:hypothetical protein